MKLSQIIKETLVCFDIYVKFNQVEVDKVLIDRIQMEVKNLIMKPRNDKTAYEDLCNDLEEFFSERTPHASK